MEGMHNNPYEETSEEYQIWKMLIRNDFEGFLNCNWELVDDDYHVEGFFGIDMAISPDPSNWKLTFPTLAGYKNQWLNDCIEFNHKQIECDAKDVLYSTTHLENFYLKHDRLLVHKVFNGSISLTNEPSIELKWRSLFLMKLDINQKWKVAGFCGYIHEK